MSDDAYQDDGPRWWLWGGGILLAVIVLPLIFVRGCGDDPVTDGQQVVDDRDEAAADERCERQLDSVMAGLQPVQYGLSENVRGQVDDLNSWRVSCAQGEWDLSTDRELRQTQLSDAAFAVTESERFTQRDADYLRTTLLAQQTAQELAAGTASDVDRAVDIFRYVCRNVRLIGAGLPLTSYEVRLFGIGTAADRSWVFAELLRQLRIDCVLLQPEGSEHFLTAVIIPGEGVLLFDTELATPIPASTDRETPLEIDRPATLEQVLENPELLTALDLPDRPFPITAEQLQDSEVLLIGVPAQFAPRMGLLQAGLSAAQSVDAYTSLAATPLQKQGLVERIAAAKPEWSSADVRIWDYPARQVAAATAETESGSRAAQLAGFFESLKAPYLVYQEEGPDGNSQARVEAPPHTLGEARIHQLALEYSEALPIFLRVRLAARQVPANAFAAEHATFWVPICQYERGQYQAAEDGFRKYLADYPRGLWAAASSTLLAETLARQSDYQAAIAVLEERDSTQPLPPADRLLLRRLKTAAGE